MSSLDVLWRPLFESDLPSLGDWKFGPAQAEKISQPVLCVLGTDTAPLFTEGRDLLHALLPQTQDAVLAGATHLLQMAQPAEAAAMLVSFLKNHAAAAQRM